MEDGRFSEYLEKYGKKILYGLLACVTLLALFYRLSNQHTDKLEKDYIEASQDFLLFVRPQEGLDPIATKKALDRLKELITIHPELHAAYDGPLGQILLIRNEVEQAKPFMLSTFARIKCDDLSFYQNYASTTLNIAEKKFQEALIEALGLQSRMKDLLKDQKDKSQLLFGDQLFALNLLRIALLQQHLDDKSGELTTWQTWKHYAGLEKNQKTIEVNVDPQAFRRVMQQLAIGSFSLPDYISYREKALHDLLGK